MTHERSMIARTGQSLHKRPLRDLGTPSIISPQFAHGSGIGDLVIGSTLVEIKLSTKFEDSISNQLNATRLSN